MDGRDSIIWRKDNRKDRKTAMEKTLWEIYNDTQLAELETLTADYKDFLDAGKTERECVTEDPPCRKRGLCRLESERYIAGRR